MARRTMTNWQYTDRSCLTSRLNVPPTHCATPLTLLT